MVETPARRFAFGARLQDPLIFILLLLAVLSVLGQANPMTSRLGRDSGMYAYVASHLLHGETPYVTAWEHKPPAIFFIDAAGLALGGGTRWGLWAVEFIFLVGASLAGFAVLRRNFGLGPALLSSLIWLSGLGLVLEGGNFTEEYSLFFSFISLLIFSRVLQRRDSLWLHAALGIAFGCSFLTRPNNAGVPLAIVLTEVVLILLKQGWLISPGSLKGLMVTGAGFIVPLIAAASYFAARGAFQPFLDAAFIYNLSYGGHMDLAGALLGGIRNLGFATGAGLVGMWVAYDLLIKQVRSRDIDPLILWLCLDFVIEIGLSGLSGLNYPHYFISWLPWIAVACALLFNKLFTAFAAWSEMFAAPFLTAVLLGVALLSWGTLADYVRSFSQLAHDRSQVQQVDLVAQYVNEHTLPGDTVLAWGGAAGINFLSERQAPTAHFQYGILVASRITDRISAQFYTDLSSHPPVLIVDGSGGDSSGDLVPLSTPNPVEWSAAHNVYAPPYLQEFFDFVHQNYVYKTSVAGLPIYRLNR